MKLVLSLALIVVVVLVSGCAYRDYTIMLPTVSDLNALGYAGAPNQTTLIWQQGSGAARIFSFGADDYSSKQLSKDMVAVDVTAWNSDSAAAESFAAQRNLLIPRNGSNESGITFNINDVLSVGNECTYTEAVFNETHSYSLFFRKGLYIVTIADTTNSDLQRVISVAQLVESKIK